MAFRTITRTAHSEHATLEDCRRAFTDSRDELMRLAQFLTGDIQLAEECVVDACALAMTPNGVFEDWLASWARRATIRCAAALERPHIAALASLYKQHACTHGKHHSLAVEAKELLAVESDVLTDRLDVLCRFALIMRGIENYSALDSALMLGITTPLLEAAYCTALQALESISCEPVAEQAVSVYGLMCDCGASR